MQHGAHGTLGLARRAAISPRQRPTRCARLTTSRCSSLSSSKAASTRSTSSWRSAGALGEAKDEYCSVEHRVGVRAASARRCGAVAADVTLLGQDVAIALPDLAQGRGEAATA